jgi:hypothetical protein
VLDPKITATALQKTDSFRHDIPKPKLELLQLFFSQLLNLVFFSSNLFESAGIEPALKLRTTNNLWTMDSPSTLYLFEGL